MAVNISLEVPYSKTELLPVGNLGEMVFYHLHIIVYSCLCWSVRPDTTRKNLFTNHLVSFALLQGDRFEQYQIRFPENALSTNLKAFSMLNEHRAKSLL